MIGLHLIAELYACRCPGPLLADAAALRQACLSACAKAGLTLVGEVFHQFGSVARLAGATGVVVLAESHLAVHTWPESGTVTLDLYVCNFTQDNSEAARQACRELMATFQPAHLVQREVARGVAMLASGVVATPGD